MTADPGASTVPTIFEPEFAPLATALLHDYFRGTRDNGQPWFTGARFESLGSAWNEPSNMNRFTADDVVALSCLSISVPGTAAIRILEHQADSIGSLLAEMPRPGVSLWEVPESEIDADSAAHKLWRLLRSERDGLGQTTVSKLMARKRADLVPIYDSVVAEALGMADSTGHWKKMRQLMLTTGQDGIPLHQRLGAMAAGAGLAPLVTPLRVFDVVVWYAYNSGVDVRARARGIADGLHDPGELSRVWTA